MLLQAQQKQRQDGAAGRIAAEALQQLLSTKHQVCVWVIITFMRRAG
jgi:hypothetical protein